MEDAILTSEAKQFLTELHRRFNPERTRLLQERARRQKELDAGIAPDVPAETEAIRQDLSWKIPPPPPGLERRWVEITGPTDRKMMINALNSGADVFMADFEDANAPTWENMLEGQKNLNDAVYKRLSYQDPKGKLYQLQPATATLMVRPRGLHLEEAHFLVDGEPIAGSFLDFGLSFFHNARQLLASGSGPYYYLPKLESRMEARLWNAVFLFAQNRLSLPRGTIRATILIETILAAFEMEEILYELKEHSAGLNAGRWDYIFSIIKKFSANKEWLFPDRAQITMQVPFMKAYTTLLVQTCHKRGAYAIGGMSAFIPNRKDPLLNEAALKKVREDKEREVSEGFDGTWVAHPDLVPIAREIFEKGLKGKNAQLGILRKEAQIDPEALLRFEIANGTITEAGFRQNVAVALLYLTSWLSGTGAAALFNLMEDAATAEISRAQLWHWAHHPQAALQDGRKIDAELYKKIVEEESEKALKMVPEKSVETFWQARALLDQLVLNDNFQEFLTLIAYEKLCTDKMRSSS